MSMKEEKKQMSIGPFWLFALLHLLCCGLPLVVLSTGAASLIAPTWSVVGAATAIVSLVGFVWHLKQDCAACPRDEGVGALDS